MRYNEFPMIQIDWLTPGVPTPIRLYYRLVNADPTLKPYLKNQFIRMMRRCRLVHLEDFQKLNLDVFSFN